MLLKFLNIFLFYIILELTSAGVVLSSNGTTTGAAPAVTTTQTSIIDFVKSKNDIVKNMRKQFEALKFLTDEFKEVFKNETAYASDTYKNLTENIRYYLSEPGPEECQEVDQSLVHFYPFGNKESDYITNLDQLNEYCSKLEGRIEHLKSWVRRKYRYNIPVQVSLGIIIQKITDKNHYYCNATAHKENYIRNMKIIKEINSKLVPVKERLIDTAILIRNASFGGQLPKLGRLCCAFWEYNRRLRDVVKDSGAVDFAVDMSETYYSSGTKYLCFLYPFDSPLCKDQEPAPKVAHKWRSWLMEAVLTIGDIGTLAE